MFVNVHVKVSCVYIAEAKTYFAFNTFNKSQIKTKEFFKEYKIILQKILQLSKWAALLGPIWLLVSSSQR